MEGSRGSRIAAAEPAQAKGRAVRGRPDGAQPTAGCANPRPSDAGQNFAELDAERRRLALVERAAQFAAAFGRWKDDQRCDGVGYEQMRVLQSLGCRGPAIMREVGEMLMITPRNMTVIVDGLQVAGLVTRHPHPTDRRATLLELTAAGRTMAGQSLTERLDAMGQIFDNLTERQQREFYDTVGQLIEEMRPAPGCRPSLPLSRGGRTAVVDDHRLAGDQRA